jgi:hypothetical protein
MKSFIQPAFSDATTMGFAAAPGEGGYPKVKE